MTGPAAVIRRMSISRSEFFRTLPDALGTRALVVSGNRISLAVPGRVLEILFVEEAPLRIASLTLPFARIELRFEGYDEMQIATAINRFDLYFRRGGG